MEIVRRAALELYHSRSDLSKAKHDFALILRLKMATQRPKQTWDILSAYLEARCLDEELSEADASEFAEFAASRFKDKY